MTRIVAASAPVMPVVGRGRRKLSPGAVARAPRRSGRPRLQIHVQPLCGGRDRPEAAGGPTPSSSRRGLFSVRDTTRRGNYDSGEDFVLEYGEHRFTFNERDF